MDVGCLGIFLNWRMQQERRQRAAQRRRQRLARAHRESRPPARRLAGKPPFSVRDRRRREDSYRGRHDEQGSRQDDRPATVDHSDRFRERRDAGHQYARKGPAPVGSSLRALAGSVSASAFLELSECLYRTVARARCPRHKNETQECGVRSSSGRRFVCTSVVRTSHLRLTVRRSRRRLAGRRRAARLRRCTEQRRARRAGRRCRADARREHLRRGETRCPRR